jgi:hypothetical protein
VGELLVESRRVDRAGKGGIGDVQLDRSVVAGLLIVELGLVRIVRPLGVVGGVERVDLGHRVIVA